MFAENVLKINFGVQDHLLFEKFGIGPISVAIGI